MAIEIDLEYIKEVAAEREGENLEFLVFLKQLDMAPQELDAIVHEIVEEVSSQIDCKECANCCKTISPTIFNSDIRRMAASLKIKTSVFTDKYLLQDEEGEFVFNRTPCPFLGNDNFCEIYDFRPKACREYPHTDRSRFYQILELTARNSKICPAVYNIITKLKIVLK